MELKFDAPISKYLRTHIYLESDYKWGCSAVSK